MGGVHSFDGGFHKREALGVDVTLETHEDTVGWQDANDMSLDGFTVPLAGENAVLDAAGEDAGRGIVPNHKVSIRPEDLVSGEDRVLDFTLELIEDHE